MDKSGSVKPLISQGWLRALLFLIAFGVATGIFLGIYLIAVHKGEPGYNRRGKPVKGQQPSS